MKGWTKSAQSDVRIKIMGEGTSKEVVEMVRFRSLSAMSIKVYFYASKSAYGYAMLTNGFNI